MAGWIPFYYQYSVAECQSSTEAILVDHLPMQHVNSAAIYTAIGSSTLASHGTCIVLYFHILLVYRFDFRFDY